MTDHSHSKIVIDVPFGGLETLPPGDVIRICADALREISDILARNIIDVSGVLHNDKSAAKLIKKYVDDAVYWADRI